MSSLSSTRLIFLVGLPWTGRREVGERLALSIFGQHINVGKMIEERSGQDPRGLGSATFRSKWQDHLKLGNRLPDDVVVDLIQDYLGLLHTTERPLILSDMPATVSQWNLMSPYIGRKIVHSRVVFFDALEDTCSDRGVKRHDEDYVDRRINDLRHHVPAVKDAIMSTVDPAQCFTVNANTSSVSVFHELSGWLLESYRAQVSA